MNEPVPQHVAESHELTLKLVDRTRRIEGRDLPSDVREIARQCVLDWIGVALGGSGDHLTHILLEEAVSDPDLNAWYDRRGAENADKCAWTFGGSYVLFGTQKWKIQGNWSNYDYDHNTGYANSSGQKGCADGTNYPGPFTR